MRAQRRALAGTIIPRFVGVAPSRKVRILLYALKRVHQTVLPIGAATLRADRWRSVVTAIARAVLRVRWECGAPLNPVILDQVMAGAGRLTTPLRVISFRDENALLRFAAGIGAIVGWWTAPAAPLRLRDVCSVLPLDGRRHFVDVCPWICFVRRRTRVVASRHVEMADDVLAFNLHVHRPRHEVDLPRVRTRDNALLGGTPSFVPGAPFEVRLVLQHHLLP